MIFGRTSETNSLLSKGVSGLGWVLLAINIFTLYPYFLKVFSSSNWWYLIAGSFGGVLLILSIEFAAITVLFEPNVLLEVVERPTKLLNSKDPIVKNVSGIATIAGIVMFCALSAYIFWFDYSINLNQMRGASGSVAGTLQFRQIIAALFVLGSEIAFGCANVLKVSSGGESSGSGYSDTSRRNA